MSGDLVGGQYPLTNPLFDIFGRATNATQTNLPVRSNVSFFGGFNVLTDASAALTSGKVTVVPVPVEVGDPISKVDVYVGATAASTPTHSFAVLYSAAASPKVIGTQSTDGTTAAIAASATFTFTLGSTYVVQSADAPNGFIYVGVSVTGTAVPSLVAVGGTVATACQYQLYTNSPVVLAGNFGSSVGGTAPAWASPSAQTAVPLIGLR